MYNVITNDLKIEEPFTLENGFQFEMVTIRYTVIAASETPTKVAWVFHALTGNSNPEDWWPEMIGKNKILDPFEYKIICANVLGSCYGTTGPNHKEWEGKEFPLVTIQDMVRLHQKLAIYENIDTIHLGIGGSLGGQQLLEWAVLEPFRFEKIVPIACNAKHSSWGIAFNEAQRMALELDEKKGLAVARAIGMISYRSFESFENFQSDPESKFDQFKASSYLRYQGKKLVDRFHPLSYYSLTKSMDSHDLGRNRGGLENALKTIKAETIVVGISSDILFPTTEQKRIANQITDAVYEEIDSLYGHDGFLVEHDLLTKIINKNNQTIKVKV